MLGLAVPHLKPIVTIVTPFASVVDYRYYRLVDTTEVPTEDDLKSLYKLKDKAQGYYRSLQEFDGTDPLALFEFLALFRGAMNKHRKSEAVAVRVLSSFIMDDAEARIPCK